jgi:hypothetical protein
MDMEMFLRFSGRCNWRHIHKITTEYRIADDNATVRDRAANHFLGHVIRNYHIFRKGEVAYTKYFLHKGWAEKAQELYQDISAGYADSFHTASLVKELLPLAERFRDRRFDAILMKDYFHLSPKQCFRAAIESKSARMLACILPESPSVVLKYVATRALRRGRMVFLSVNHLYKSLLKSIKCVESDGSTS